MKGSTTCRGFALSFMMFLAAGNAGGGTYVVSPQGNDNNPGTLEQPWRSIFKANVTLEPGDTVLVREGSYQEQIKPQREGESGRPIVYSAMPGEYPVIEGEPGNLIVVIASNHSVIEGFTIRCQAHLTTVNKPEYWVHLEGNYISLRRCRILADGDAYANYGAGLLSRAVVVAGVHNVVEHCYVRGQAMGVVISGGLPRFTILRSDTIVNNGSSNVVILSHEDASKFDRTYQGTLIEDCVLDTSWDEDNIQFEPNYLDHTQTYNNGVIIRRTRLGHAAENCIDFKGAGSVLVDNCLLYGAEGDDNGRYDGADEGGGAGLNLGLGEISQYVIVRRCVLWDNHSGAYMYDGYRYYNNVFLNNRRSYRGPDGDPIGNEYSHVEIWNKPAFKRALVNNIFGMQPNRGVLNLDIDFGGNFATDNNLYFGPDVPVRFYHSMTVPKTITEGLANWQQILNTYSGYAYIGGKEANSIEADPQFVNVPLYPADYDESWDFGVREGSAAIDAGRPVTYAVGSADGSQTLQVDDARFFCDGYGVTDGDLIKIGSGEPVTISAIDTLRNIITINAPRSWSSGDGVHLAYEGAAPDVGAVEFVAGAPQAPGTPTLAAPPAGAAELTQPVVLNWSATSATISYYPQVAADAEFATIVANPGAIAQTNYSVSGLSGGTTYYWRVRSGNGAGVSSWSEVRSFTTAQLIPNAPPSPQLYNPPAGASSMPQDVDLTWRKIAEATAYYPQVAADAAFSSITADPGAITDTTYMVSGLKTGTTYYWRVRAGNDGGLSDWSSARSFTTQQSAPGAPSTSLPTSESSGVTTNPLLTWQSAPGASSYRIQVSTRSSFDSLVFDKQGVTELGILVEGLSTGTTYYWRVRATGAGGTSAWSVVSSFTTFEYIPRSSGNLVQNSDFQNGMADWGFAGNGAATLTVSGEGYADNSAAMIAITAPSAPVQLYQDNVVLNPDSTYSIRFAAKSTSGNDCEVSVIKATPPYTSYGVSKSRVDLGTAWKLFSVELDPAGFGSPVNDARLLFDFGTYGSAGDVILLDQISVAGTDPPIPPDPSSLPKDYFLEENYPNPFNPNTTVQYTLPTDEYVIVKVINLLGQEVLRLVDGYQTRGRYEVTLDLKGHASGTYLITLFAGPYIQTRKVMLVK